MIKESLLLVIRKIEEEIEDRWGRDALFEGPVSEKLNENDADYQQLQSMRAYYLHTLYCENKNKTQEFRHILRKNRFHEGLHCLKYYSWDIEDGIFPLVLELNRFGIETLESCEGHFGDTWSYFRAPSIFPWVYLKRRKDIVQLKAQFASLIQDQKVRFSGTMMVLNVANQAEREVLIQHLTTLLQISENN